MLRFKELTIKNFLSYGEAPTTINLDKVGTTLIIGEDLDNTASGIGGNGVGKTTWVNALIYGLYGKPLSEISMDKLVNNINKKNMRVDVEFEKDNKITTVRRARKEKGGGNYAKVFVRNTNVELDELKHDVTPANVNDINDFIVEILGIPYELFVRIVAFAATHTPFLSLPVRHASKANQSDIMEELFRLTQLSTKADGVKQQIKDTKQTLDIKIRHNEQLEIEHERYNKQLETAKNRVDDWEADRKKQLESWGSDLEAFEAVPIEEQEELYKMADLLKEQITRAKEVQTVAEKTVTDISTKLTVARAQLTTVSTERAKIVEWREDNSKMIGNMKTAADKLPSEVFLNEQHKLNGEIKELEAEIIEYVSRETSLVNDIETIQADKKVLSDESTHLSDAKCPYCLQNFKDAGSKLKECGLLIDALDKKEIKNKKKLRSLEKKQDIADIKLSTLNKQVELSSIEIIGVEIKRKNSVEKLEELLNAKCPYGNISDIDAMFNAVDSLNIEIEENTTVLDEESTVLVGADEAVDKLVDDLKSCNSNIMFDSITALYDIKNEIKIMVKDVTNLKAAVNPYTDPLRELEEITIEPIDTDSVNDLDNLLTHQNYMVKLLTKKDSFIRKNLLTKNLSFLNQRLAHYLKQLGLPHKVAFTEEMTANITQFGRELDFGNLSSGQKARVNLGLSFSFRDVLQKSHDSINVCMLDEVLDVGLDSVGVQNAARMLKHKAREEDLALYIISHRDEVSNIFDNRMVVQMEKGFSSVKVEE